MFRRGQIDPSCSSCRPLHTQSCGLYDRKISNSIRYKIEKEKKIVKSKILLVFFCWFNSGLAADEDSAPVIIYSTGKAGLPESEKTWAKHLQDAGYITQAIGKNYYLTFIYLKWYLYLRDFVLVPCKRNK